MKLKDIFIENQDVKAIPPKNKPTKVGEVAHTKSEFGPKYPNTKWVAKAGTHGIEWRIA